ncbi:MULTISPECIES: hypothetical protein [Elizabethkingia]|uniref:hypothetical protein n=1 Tax=Elizabethkingia TaxID=308865 RepID=UPI001623C7C8|nr:MULTISPECIES: hypothetical protein [Elizabethkingia]MBG0514080.1 hypothetical protein [Elizabethkingia meningoseptica]MCL1636294.1 hypothetical protein [Elizabethkingia bruuniana]MDE5432996.1 hypothetical protein [Elizabethkingia meningoseptica]
MNLRNIQKASDIEVENWLKESIPELTSYQKSKIYNDEIVRFSPFKFYKEKKETSNVWLRLSIIFLPIVWIILFLFLPLTFIITGRWGYSNKFNWILNWMDKVKI